MKQTGFFKRRVSTGIAATCLIATLSGGAYAQEKTPDTAATPDTAEALLYCTMPSNAAHRPEMAMDGDANSYFKSAYGMSDGDNFLVLFSRPVPIQSLRIVTGDADNQDLLTDGVLETSPDAAHFSRAADFDSKGIAEAEMKSKPVLAFRIHLNRRRGLPALLIREITVKSSMKIAHVQWGPGRGFADISEAPDVAEWARKAEQQMEEFWPDTAALLYSDKFITPNMVNVVYRTGKSLPPGATGGGVMVVDIAWCRAHPDDTGLTVHETAHVIQACSAYDPVWLIEGIADYVRWIKFEPENYHVRINAKTATYHDSYRTTATFLAWCELHYDNRLVTKLNHDVRFGNYKKDLFKQYCGKDVDTLWTEFIAAYQADPVHIITPPVAAADRPRPVPVVKPGSSVAIDLSAAFKSVGFVADGAMFPADGGFDGGGAAYSAALLGTAPMWKEVTFHPGRADAPNVVTCAGNVIDLPAGDYASLWLMGAAVEGAQMEQTFTVTYADGSKDALVQNISDWFQPGRYPGENRAVKMAYRNMAGGEKDPRTFYVYSYGFPLNSAKAVKSLTLPDNANVKILAVSVAQ